MISIVCVYNNQETMDNFLLESLKDQSVEFELILMDNTKEKFKSAAEALNKGGEKAKGDYLMFVHQDIDLQSDLWLQESEKILNSLDNVGIAGVAGNPEDIETVITNIKHGEPPHRAGEVQIDSPKEVETLDECLIIIPKQVFRKLQFDTETCYGWHSYGIDYSLGVKKIGLKVYVLPLTLHHRSTGLPIDEEYFISLEMVRKKYKKDFRRISTTTGKWSTLYPLNIQRHPFFQRRLKGLLKKLGYY